MSLIKLSEQRGREAICRKHWRMSGNWSVWAAGHQQLVRLPSTLSCRVARTLHLSSTVVEVLSGIYWRTDGRRRWNQWQATSELTIAGPGRAGPGRAALTTAYVSARARVTTICGNNDVIDHHAVDTRPGRSLGVCLSPVPTVSFVHKQTVYYRLGRRR